MSISSPTKQDSWREMLREFRVLGGTAENVRCGEGALGRGLFAEEASRPIKLHTPAQLLVPIEDVVFENGNLRVAASSKMGSAERLWFERYESEFSWGGGGRSDVVQYFEGISTLPQALREKLATVFSMSQFVEEPTEEAVQQRFLKSRVITINKHDFVMPIIELLNHGRGPAYDTTAGVAVSGTFDGEIVVSYCELDALRLFQNWGFSSDQAIAYSLPLVARSQDDRTFGELRIARQTSDGAVFDVGGPKFMIPKFTAREGGGELSFLMLGNKLFPRMPRAIFQKVFREAGRQIAEERFELIRRTNMVIFLALLGDLERLDGSMAISLRTMCRHQLESLASCFGTRAI